MKLLVYILGVMVLNVVVTIAAALAFMLFLFRGDPILAAVPAVLAAPAVLLQPWFVAFLFLPNGLYLTPFLTTVVTVIVYGTMDTWGMLERPKLILSKLKRPRSLIAVGAVLLLAVGVAFARYVDFPSLNEGTPPYVRVSGLDIADSRYYCLGQFIDSQWLWQARVAEPDLTRLAEQVRLRPVGRDQVPDEFRSMPPHWWRPSIMDRTRILSTPDFPVDDRGPDGLHVLATWNPDDQVLHVWIKNNF